MSLGWNVFAYSLHQEKLQERLTDGIKAAIELYYEEYSQEVSVYNDAPFVGHLLHVMEHGSNFGHDEKLRELVLEVEDDMVANRARDCDGNMRTFTTKRTEED